MLVSDLVFWWPTSESSTKKKKERKNGKLTWFFFVCVVVAPSGVWWWWSLTRNRNLTKKKREGRLGSRGDNYCQKGCCRFLGSLVHLSSAWVFKVVIQQQQQQQFTDGQHSTFAASLEGRCCAWRHQDVVVVCLQGWRHEFCYWTLPAIRNLKKWVTWWSALPLHYKLDLQKTCSFSLPPNLFAFCTSKPTNHLWMCLFCKDLWALSRGTSCCSRRRRRRFFKNSWPVAVDVTHWLLVGIIYLTSALLVIAVPSGQPLLFQPDVLSCMSNSWRTCSWTRPFFQGKMMSELIVSSANARNCWSFYLRSAIRG